MLTIFRVSPGLKHTIRLMSLAPRPVTSGLFPDSMSQLRQLNPTLYLQILCLSHWRRLGLGTLDHRTNLDLNSHLDQTSRF